MQWAYHKAGIDIPRVAADQMHFGGGEKIDRAHLRAGDLIGFADPSGYVHHIGMYLGDGKFIHAPHTGDVVKVSDLSDPYYKAQFAGGMRLDKSAGGAPAVAQAAVAPAAPPAAAAATPPPAAADAAAQPAGPQRTKTEEFLAIKAQESSYHRQTAMFLQAVDPKMARAHAAGVSPEKLAAAAAAQQQAPAPPAAPAAPAADVPIDLAGASGDYPGDTAAPQEIARWMAKHAKEAGLPPELPVMASLVESGMKNLHYGDASSVGYFQMLTTIWNTGKYAGYQSDPQKQLQWFIDHAVEVKNQRIARGLPVDDPNQFGEWIADVERPAAQYRGRYQLRLDQARKVLGAG
jgi:hypothetical protein